MSFLKKFFKNYSLLLIFSVILFFFFLISNVFSWSYPTDNPPNANLPSPINTSSQEQTKSGNLILENDLTVGGLLRVGLFSSHPTGTNGALYYNSQDHKFYGYQNGSWQELGAGSGGIWSVNGNDIYYTNGNVGIGTTAPYSKLTISPASATYFTFGTNIGGVPNDNIAAFYWDTTNNFLGIQAVTQNVAYRNLILEPDGGNVGIGTTSPTEKLEVSGNIKLSGASPTYRITNVASPVNSSDVATKGYVDAINIPPAGFPCPAQIESSDRTAATLVTAISTCRNKGNNWRLPTAEELACFIGSSGVSSSSLWTRTPIYSYNTRSFWVIIRLTDGTWTYSYYTNSEPYRCVQ